MTEPRVAQKTKIFFSKFTSRTYNKGETLIHEGDQHKQIFYLDEGYVRQYLISKDGEEITLNIYKPGAFFPMAWVVESYTNSYSFDAIDDTTVFFAEYEKVVAFLKKEPDVMFDLLQRLYIGFDGVLSHMKLLMSGNARKNIIITLVIFAKRFGVVGQRDIVIKLKLPHKDLAAYTGLTRETVSREMKLLQQQKLIDYSKEDITIIKMSSLEKELL